MNSIIMRATLKNKEQKSSWRWDVQRVVGGGKTILNVNETHLRVG